MREFRVAISGDFLKADGSPAFPDWDMAPLSGPMIKYFYVERGEVPAEALEDADAAIILVSPFGARSIPDNGRLAIVTRFGVGYDSVDISACTKAHVAVGITPEAIRRPVGVMALTFILALSQKLMVKDRLGHMGQEGWARKTDFNGMGLIGRTVGILGFGGTGREFMALVKPFGMNVIAYDPYTSADEATEYGVRMVAKETLFREADFVVVMCLLTAETRKLVDAKMLGLMKSTAYLINVARGPIVDQNALARALEEGHIAGAALDVLEKEPPDVDDPILACENTIITPHALCWTDQMFSAIGAENVRMVREVMCGCVPRSLVNPEIANDPVWVEKLSQFAARFGN